MAIEDFGDLTREMWDEAAETEPMESRRQRSLAALKTEWFRVWDEPIPFYRDKFEAAGLTRDAMPALDEIPVTRKGELRANEAEHPVFGTHRSTRLYKDGQINALRIAQSTGTTGKAWYIFYSKDDLLRWRALNKEQLWRNGVRPGNHFTHAWPGGMYPTGILGGAQYSDLDVIELPVGPPFSAADALRHIQIWQDCGIDALMCTISQLQIYDAAAQGAGIDLASILKGKPLITSGEAIWQFEAGRKRIEDAYGVSLFNIGGASEAPGFVTADSRYHDGLICPTDHYWIQVCDPETGKEVPPGTPGHLVINAFGMDHFMLRYDLEDLVVLHEGPDKSGRTAQRYTILGRLADRAIVGGKALLPIDVQLALETFGAPEYTMAAGVADALMLNIEGEGSAARLTDGLSAALGVPVVITEVPVGSIPRSTFKQRRLAE